jgi:quercetin dioxygenase-like cupin family protein
MPETQAARISERGTEMSENDTVVADLFEMVEIAESGIVSKAIVENEHHKIVHFSFAKGQELSEHTASVPAVIHVLQGKGTVVLGGERHAAGPGSLYYMPADLRHAVVADEELVFLLTMFRT